MTAFGGSGFFTSTMTGFGGSGLGSSFFTSTTTGFGGSTFFGSSLGACHLAGDDEADEGVPETRLRKRGYKKKMKVTYLKCLKCAWA